MKIYIPRIVDKAIYRTLFMPEYEKIDCFTDFKYQLETLIKEVLATYNILGKDFPHLHIPNLKEKLGLKRKWYTEFILYKIIKDIFKNFNVLFHYKISKYEVDIFIQELNIAIEYQGEQHFKPLKHLGGKNGLLKRKKIDQEKYLFLTKNNINVIYFDYMEELDHMYVANKIFNFIERINNEKNKKKEKR